jgi:hypothetical protein
MAEQVNPEIREALELAVDPEPGSWLVGLTLVLRGSDEIRGTVKRLDSEEVVMETSAGERRARIAEIQDVLRHLESPGPE